VSGSGDDEGPDVRARELEPTGFATARDTAGVPLTTAGTTRDGVLLRADLPTLAQAGDDLVANALLSAPVPDVGDMRFSTIHPAATTYGRPTVDRPGRAGVLPGLVRLSVGIEDLPDILADPQRGPAEVRRPGPAGSG